MKTQISRDSFQPEKRYTGVHQQQGRVITDADWNELVAVCREQLIQALADVVGNGSPRSGAVSITTDRKIQPGDLYVDGIRAELPGSTPLLASAQPDLPGYPVLPATGPYIVYADVWDRVVTSLEDDKLRDPGLHGADTCTRTQTMLQVKTCPDTVNPETGIPKRGNATLSLSLHANLESGDPCDPCAGLISAGRGRVGSYLFRLEVHAVEGTAANPTRLVLKWSSENGAEQYEAMAVDKMPPGFVASNHVYEFHNLTTEKQLGVFLGTGFTPTNGVIKTTYEIPSSSPKELVRRWDGFCELTQAGSVWSLVTGVDKGVTLTTGGLATAPGHVTLGSGIQINLEALQLTLDLAGKTFMAGDFWLGMVREAVLNPGDAVLTGAEPRGIVHHYLLLARVQADGTLIPFNDADKRRHSFPPLTDLHAHDVGYTTTCSSGLFDATHDNVEKALNRLCQLAAEHIAYTADCSKGLYAGFVGTAKQALDKICEIKASHIGFAKPCNTSIYQGQTIDTVDDVLNLLCDIQARQISYRPGDSCTFLKKLKIDTVQDALDALCSRPGCRITVGPKVGFFDNLEVALETLLGKDEKNERRDICLCLLPGDHKFTGRLIEPKSDGVNLCLSGCGHATRLHLINGPAHFKGFSAVCLSDMEIIAHDSPGGALVFDRCLDLSLKDLMVNGYIDEDKVLVKVSRAQTASLHGLELEAYGSESTKVPAELPTLGDLFKNVDRAVFNDLLPDCVHKLANMDIDERDHLVEDIDNWIISLMRSDPLSARELQSYAHLITLLKQDEPMEAAFFAALKKIRLEAVREHPAVALAINDAAADWTLTDCDILGIVILYGSNPAGPLSGDLKGGLNNIIKEVDLHGLGTTFRANGCRISRIDLSYDVYEHLEKIVRSGGTLDNLFSSALLSDLTLLCENNQVAFVDTNLSTSVLDARQKTDALLVIGVSAIYVGIRGNGSLLRNILRDRFERVGFIGIDFM